MIFFDTNVLVYCIVPHDAVKQNKSLAAVEQALAEKQIALSPLVLSELIYVLAKLNTNEDLLRSNVE